MSNSKERLKILILSANPKNTDRLRLDEEVREIEEALERSKSRNQFEIIQKSAVRVDDLRRSLLDHNPYILHFSGHGIGNNGIALENKLGQAQLVSTESLGRLFNLFKDELKCVFLNACYSEIQATAIHQHIDYVIGMNKAIGDRAAIEFAKGFYDAIGAERSIEDAFEVGCTSIDLESIPESSTPVLKTPQDRDLKVNQAVQAGENQKSVNSRRLIPDPTQQPIQPQNSQAALCQSKPSIVLETPEGQVPLASNFYVDRPPIEADCYENIVMPGALIRIKAPRQMGKTSLLSRVLSHAEQQGYQTATLNFQSADAKSLQDLNLFLKWFCASLTNELNLANRLNDYWQDVFLGTKDKCTNFFQRYLLVEIKTPLILGLDEVDEVFKHPEVAVDFFGLLRSWHERSKNNAIWQKLRLVITHSKEVYIPLNINQSPFNVGLAIELPVLTPTQVNDLIQRHGLSWTDAQLEHLMTLLGGHPYLTRVALYRIARGRITLEQLEQIAPTEEGPYSDHLRRHLLNLEETQDSHLLDAARQVFASQNAVDVGTTEAFKLQSMGIVKLQGNQVMPLCELYHQYFRNRLGVS